MIYQDPLAYLLGLEGIALLDAWAGDHDREFTDLPWSTCPGSSPQWPSSPACCAPAGT